MPPACSSIHERNVQAGDVAAMIHDKIRLMTPHHFEADVNFPHRNAICLQTRNLWDGSMALQFASFSRVNLLADERMYARSSTRQM